MFQAKRKLVFGVLLGLLCPMPLLADDVSDKIAELRKKRESVGKFRLVATSTTRSGQGTRQARIELWEKIGDGKQLARRVITTKTQPGTTDEQTAVPSLMVKDGERAWREMDMGDRKLVFSGDAKIHHEYIEMEPILSTGIAKISPADKILDHPVVLLEIREKANENDLIASYWISERTGLILKSIVESAGATITEMKVEELDLENTFSDTLFNYKPPADAKVIQDTKGG